MEVILLESFDKLGKIGDVVNVKDGFARNFLIPKKKALRANEENKEYFSKIKKNLVDENKKLIDEAKKIVSKIEKEEIIFIRNASDNGQLYGSVSPRDISNFFTNKKIEIKPVNINLHNPIKKIGIYTINVKLHAEVSCNLSVNVATSDENANKQKIEFDKPTNESQSIKKENAKKSSEKKESTSKVSSKKVDDLKSQTKNSEMKPNDVKENNNVKDKITKTLPETSSPKKKDTKTEELEN